MPPKRRIAFLVGGLVIVGVAVVVSRAHAGDLVLTGIVTTNDVIISPQVGGQISKLLVNEGDSVKRDELLAVIAPGELQADQEYFTHSAEGLANQVQGGEATLRYQELQTAQQIKQTEATLAAIVAQQAEASANLQNAKLALDRSEKLATTGNISAQDLDQARTTYAVAKARLDAANKQVDAQQATVDLARANQEQVDAQRSVLVAERQQETAAAAQQAKAAVRLGYTELRAPTDGIVDVRAARQGEVVNAGQPVLTVINPDDLWVRADVEETYVERIRIGDSLMVRLPSGEERKGRVFYRGVDADFATARDVSRSKRDIKTFEIRLRLDNRDRHLAVGMTAYVVVPKPS